MAQKQKTLIQFSEGDLIDLQNGKEFTWNYDGVDVTLFNEWTSDRDIENIPEASPTNVFIDLTESDIAELREGEEFEWSFQDIDFLLVNEDFYEMTEEEAV